MGLPLNKRDYDIFLSYAHSERKFVERLYQWLRQSAGFEVWWDDRELSAGALLATDLQKAIERCRGVLLVASDESLTRGWVQAEYNAAMDERANHNGFRMVALRMGNADAEQLMRGISWIDVPNGIITRQWSRRPIAYAALWLPGAAHRGPLGATVGKTLCKGFL
jgi:hypothetical protein